MSLALNLRVLVDNHDGSYSAGGKTFDLSGLDTNTQARVATIIDYEFQTASTNAFSQYFVANLGSNGHSNTIHFYSNLDAWGVASGRPTSGIERDTLGGLTSTWNGNYIYLNDNLLAFSSGTPYWLMANNTIHELLHTLYQDPAHGMDHHSNGTTQGPAPYDPGLWPDVINILASELTLKTGDQFFDPVI